MADRSFLSRHHYVLLAGFLGLVLFDVTMATNSSLWNNVGRSIVTSSESTRNASSVVSRCVMECQQMGSCVSVAFDPEADTCYLQPTYRPARQGDTGPPLDVYTREKVSECKPSEAPEVAKAHVTKWQLTSTSLDGDVSCDADYMLSADETPKVLCQLENGTWTTQMTASCKQFAWRNYTVTERTKYLLPCPAKVGLSVRVKGTPTKRFEVNLKTGGNDIALHVNPRLEDSITILDYYKGGQWGVNVKLALPSHPFPFDVGVPFEMVITAVSRLNFTVEVNGAHYGQITGVIPVTDVTRVTSGGVVSIESLILAC